MSKFAASLARIQRFWLFAVAGLIQVALIALMVGDRVRILRTGTEVTLKTRAVDPHDFLRGDYVALNYDISSVLTGELKDTPVSGLGMFLYVKLAPGADGFHQAVSVHREIIALAAGEALIRGRVTSRSNCGDTRQVFCSSVQLDYGLESFFVPQGEGKDIEKARNDGKLAVVAAVAPGGRAAIKRLLLDGKPIYDEPLF
jgi:uncharacterized membrane-anchored protein